MGGTERIWEIVTGGEKDNRETVAGQATSGGDASSHAQDLGLPHVSHGTKQTLQIKKIPVLDKSVSLAILGTPKYLLLLRNKLARGGGGGGGPPSSRELGGGGWGRRL